MKHVSLFHHTWLSCSDSMASSLYLLTYTVPHQGYNLFFVFEVVESTENMLSLSQSESPIIHGDMGNLPVQPPCLGAQEGLRYIQYRQSWG